MVAAIGTAKMHFTVPPNGAAKLHFGAHFQAPGLPNQTAGTVDVYGLQILDATLEATRRRRTRRPRPCCCSTSSFTGGRRRHAGHPGCCWSPRSPPFTVRGFQLEGYAMTLSAFAWNIVRTYTLTPGRRYSFGWTSRCRRVESRSCTSELDGLTAQGNVGCDQLLRNDVNCTDVFSTGVDASGAVSCARPRAAECRRAAWSAADKNLQELGPDAPRRRKPLWQGRPRRRADEQRTGPPPSRAVCAARPTDLGRRSSRARGGPLRRDELGHGLRAALGGLEQVSNNSAAPNSGPELRLLGNQSARVFLERDGGAHQ